MDPHTGVVSGGRFLRLWFHILLNGHKPYCWKTTDSGSCAWHLLYLQVRYPILPVLWLWWCVSAPSRQHALTLLTLPGEHCSAAALTLQGCFVFVGKMYATSHLCYLRDRRWVSAFVLFWLYQQLLIYYLLWEEGKELSCSEEIRQRLLLRELLKLFWPLFVKNKNLESFTRILGDP